MSVRRSSASVSYRHPWQNWPSGPHPRPRRRWRVCCRARGRCRGTDEPDGPSARHGSRRWSGHAGGNGRSDERTWTIRQQRVNENIPETIMWLNEITDRTLKLKPYSILFTLFKHSLTASAFNWLITFKINWVQSWWAEEILQTPNFSMALFLTRPMLNSDLRPLPSYLPVLVSTIRAPAQHLKEDSTAPTATASEGSRVRRVERRSSSNSCLWNVAASASRAIWQRRPVEGGGSVTQSYGQSLRQRETRRETRAQECLL